MRRDSQKKINIDSYTMTNFLLSQTTKPLQLHPLTDNTDNVSSSIALPTRALVLSPIDPDRSFYESPVHIAICSDSKAISLNFLRHLASNLQNVDSIDFNETGSYGQEKWTYSLNNRIYYLYFYDINDRYFENYLKMAITDIVLFSTQTENLYKQIQSIIKIAKLQTETLNLKKLVYPLTEDKNGCKSTNLPERVSFQEDELSENISCDLVTTLPLMLNHYAKVFDELVNECLTNQAVDEASDDIFEMEKPVALPNIKNFTTSMN